MENVEVVQNEFKEKPVEGIKDELNAELVKKRKAKKKAKKTLMADEVRPLRKIKTSCFAISVQKGGVGKTTTTSNLALTLANKGFKVLVIDTDSQGSLTGLLNVYGKTIEEEIDGLADIYSEYIESKYEYKDNSFSIENIKKYIVRPTYPVTRLDRTEDGKFKAVSEAVEFGFDLIPGDLALSEDDILLHRVKSGGLVLYHIINLIKQEMDYDYILIDCPPSLGILTYNAIASATEGVIIPIGLEIMTIRGAKNIVKLVAQIQDELNKLKQFKIVHRGILGIVMNEYMKRSRTQRIFEEQVNLWYPLKKFESQIPSRSDCNTAHAEGLLFIQKSKDVREVFDNLADEIIMEDIRRQDETESVIVRETGLAYDKFVEMMEKNKDNNKIVD